MGNSPDKAPLKRAALDLSSLTQNQPSGSLSAENPATDCERHLQRE